MMNSTNKLSVIIPLYNAGDDFRTCMESLITQTWTALEIIIINDGSTDNSVEIAKHYAENYPHVRLLHQANAGASVARNRGIEVATGKYVAFVDADDEVYQALKCDDDKALDIKDNTVDLRIQEHVDGINALLNILCFQVGLSAGSLSFDAVQGMKTATEVISQESKTALTIRCQKNLLVEMIQQMIETVLYLAMETGEVKRGTPDVAVGFKDSVIIDDNTMIDNNIKLVSAGLKSKLTAMMEVMKCDEKTAKAELERIRAEEPVMNGGFDPTVG